MPNIRRLRSSEVSEARDHPAADDEHVPRHHGLEVDEADAEGGLREHLCRRDADRAEVIALVTWLVHGGADVGSVGARAADVVVVVSYDGGALDDDGDVQSRTTLST